VIVVENKALYALKGELADSPETIRIGEARIARPGADATIVTYGAMLHTALEAAHKLAEEGVEVEVIDLRSLQPWDETAVLASLSRTHRVVVAHEAVEAFGIGAEIVARLADLGFDELDAPLIWASTNSTRRWCASALPSCRCRSPRRWRTGTGPAAMRSWRPCAAPWPEEESR
jgi:pyruvate dehydrogenase E1 component beta subunit